MNCKKEAYWGMLCLLLLAGSCFGQVWQLKREIVVGEVAIFQPDRYGNLFVADPSGNLFKFDSLGGRLETFSAQRMGAISDLQVAQSVNVFVFYEEWQKIALLDRFLGKARYHEFEESEEIGYVQAACWASDGNLWLFDQTDFMLKKYNPLSRRVLFTFPFNFSEEEGFEISRLREHEGKIIAQSPDQLLVFNFAGAIEAKLAKPADASIGFTARALFWQSGEQELTHYHLFSGEREKQAIPKGLTGVNIHKGLLRGYSEGTIFVYERVSP